MRRSVAALGLLLAACDPGEVLLLAPGTSGGVTTLSIRAVVDTPYATLAASLAWTAGVPGAAVRAHLMTEPYDSTYWHRATTDSTGTASFRDLLPGLYQVEVTRALTSAERARNGGSPRVLAGGRRLYAPGSLDVTMAPDQRGSLVFSEFELKGVSATETGQYYQDALYFEIYNNSDTTVYLDGKYWGTAWDLLWNFSAWPCAQTEIVRNDPDGLWAATIFRFPGAGREHPLEPGRTAVIARVAIDHRALYPSLYDLSHADFEWGASGSADNPDVPNLQFAGLRMPPVWPTNSDQPEFLAEPVDLGALPRYVDPSSGHAWVRIPRQAILDAWVGNAGIRAGVAVTNLPCLEATHRNFERAPGPAFAWSDVELGVSYQRRVLAVLPDGRKLLQDTNTSMFDFVKAPRTPEWIPNP